MNDFHPCTFATPSVWVRLVWRNRGIPRRYWGRFARVFALSLAATPFRVAEHAAYSRKVKRTRVDSPLFVLGFGRSGTTHLQNLLACDPRFGCFTSYQAATAAFSLVGRGRLRRLMEKGMAQKGEQTRPMDNVKVDLDAPQEEDLALANATPMSFVHQLSFPRRGRELFAKYVMMGSASDGEARDTGEARLSPRELRRWDEAYRRALRKITLHADGKPLVLKNTVNTARADHLLRLFPDAKFVHVVRNPYDVYPSVMHLYRTLLPLYQMDDYDWEDVKSMLVDVYRQTMTKYLKDRERIPRGRIAEVRYEDLERDPLGQLRRIYQALDLPEWSGAEKHVQAYMETLTGYRKNRFAVSRADVDRVAQEWGFATDAWNYQPPLYDARSERPRDA